MTPERWAKVKAIFEEALDLPPEERAEFLERACEGDSLVRRELESLVAARDDAGTFLQDTIGLRELATPSTLNKVCTQCKSRYDASQLVCPTDGEVLVDDPEALVGTTLKAMYHIEGVLGSGGFGVVYLARHVYLRDRVAIKVLPREVSSNPDWLRRFLREGRAARMIRHPNAVAVHDLDASGSGVTFMVQEYVEGRNLRAELKQRGRIPPSEVVELLGGVAGALDAAHALGIVHRDVKPENIMVGEEGGKRIVKLLDLGIAKLREIMNASMVESTTVSHPGQIVGTPYYMSPEQWGELPRDGRSDVDGRADVYSLGVVAYELVCGTAPFRGATMHEVRRAHLSTTPPLLNEAVPSLPAAFAHAVACALSKDRADRQQSAGEFVGELRRTLADAEARGESVTWGSGGSGHGPTAGDAEQPSRLPGHPTPTTVPVAVSGGSSASDKSKVPQPLMVGTVTAIQAAAAGTLRKLLARPRRATFAASGTVAAILVGYFILSPPGGSQAHRPPEHALFWYEQGVGALREGLYLKARNALEEAVASDGQFALAHARLAEALKELDQADDAARAIGRAHSLAPDTSSLPGTDGLYVRAINDVVIANYAGAIDAYTEIARRASDEDKPYVYVDLGRAYEKNEESDKAIETYVEASRRNPNYAAPLLRLGIVYGRQGEARKAEDSFDKAEDLYQRLTNLEGRAEVLLQRGAVYITLSRVEDARKALTQALDISTAIGNDMQQVRTLFRLSSVAYTEGNAELARETAQKALDLAKAKRMEYLTAAGLVELGSALVMDGQFDEAEKYLTEGLETAKARGAPITEARASLMRGSARIERGDADSGLADVERALSFYSKGSYDEELSAGFKLRARAYAIKGEYGSALEILRQQFERARQQDNLYEIASAHEEFGSVLTQKESYLEALDHYAKCAEIYERIGDQQGMGYVLVGLAGAEWPLGRYDDAGEHLAKAAAVANQPGGSRDLAGLVARVRAEMALSQRRFGDAARLSEEALAAGNARDWSFVAEVQRVRGLAKLLLGRPREGLRYCEDAAEAANRVQVQALTARTLLARARAALANGDAAGALNAARSAHEIFERAEQVCSSFSTLLVMARASHSGRDPAGAREYATRARAALAVLEQQWGPDASGRYRSRPDVVSDLADLNQLLAN